MALRKKLIHGTYLLLAVMALSFLAKSVFDDRLQDGIHYVEIDQDDDAISTLAPLAALGSRQAKIFLSWTEVSRRDGKASDARALMWHSQFPKLDAARNAVKYAQDLERPENPDPLRISRSLFWWTYAGSLECLQALRRLSTAYELGELGLAVNHETSNIFRARAERARSCMDRVTPK